MASGALVWDPAYEDKLQWTSQTARGRSNAPTGLPPRCTVGNFLHDGPTAAGVNGAYCTPAEPGHFAPVMNAIEQTPLMH